MTQLCSSSPFLWWNRPPQVGPVLVTDPSCCQRHSDPGMLPQSQLLTGLFFFDRKLLKVVCCLRWCVWSTTEQSWESLPRLASCQMGQQNMISAPALSAAPMGPTPWMSLCTNHCSVSAWCHISHLGAGCCRCRSHWFRNSTSAALVGGSQHFLSISASWKNPLSCWPVLLWLCCACQPWEVKRSMCQS